MKRNKKLLIKDYRIPFSVQIKSSPDFVLMNYVPFIFPSCGSYVEFTSRQAHTAPAVRHLLGCNDLHVYTCEGAETERSPPPLEILPAFLHQVCRICFWGLECLRISCKCIVAARDLNILSTDILQCVSSLTQIGMKFLL